MKSFVRFLHILISIPFTFFAMFCFFTAAILAIVGTFAKDTTIFKDQDFV